MFKRWNRWIIGAAVLAISLSVFNPLARSGEPWLDYDFGGETIEFVGIWGDLRNRLTEETFDEGPGLAHKEWVEEKFNVNIEFEAYHLWPTGAAIDYIVPRMMAGEGNFMFNTVHQIKEVLVGEGLVYSVGDYVHDGYYARLPDMLSTRLQASNQFLGETFGFQAGPPEPSEAQAAIWNKSLFEREGLPSLYDLYEAGEWTWEAMQDIAIQATRDTSGDGEIDQWGVHVRHGPPGEILGVMRWVYHNDGAIAREIDGRVVLTLDEPQALEALEYWHDMVSVHEVVNKYASFTNGEVAISLDNPGAGGIMEGDSWEDMDDEYGAVPVPMGPQADSHVAVTEGEYIHMLPITTRNPEAKIELHAALYEVASPYIDPQLWEEEREEAMAYGLHFRDQESLETYMWLARNQMPIQFRAILEDHEELFQAIDDIVLGEMGASAAISGALPSAQAVIDDLYMQ